MIRETIKVTQDHINQSLEMRDNTIMYCAADDCPIAIALSERFNAKCTWAVFSGHIWGEEDNLYIEAVSRDITKQFVNAYDNNEEVFPFEFEVIY